MRAQFLQILKNIEQELLSHLKSPIESKSSVEVYASLKQRIEQLAARKDVDINQYEDEYDRLALEIYDETNLLEKKLLSNQAVAYIGTTKEEELGCLIYVSDCHLNMHEINCIKKKVSTNSSLSVRQKPRYELIEAYRVC